VSIGVVTMSKTVLSVSMRFALAAMIALCNPMLAFADNPAGAAKGVNPAASADLDGTTRTLTVGSDIFIGDDVITGPKGQVQILFADNTKLVVGPNSALKMQDYLLRNDGSAGKFVVDMLSGTFRFATGNSAKNRYELDTPTGTIGVRGTEFDVFVDRDGVTRILHYMGTVIFKAKSEKTWTAMSQLCSLGQIDDRSAILGNSKTVTGAARDRLKVEFRYANNEAPLLRPFWFLPSYDCLHNPPNFTVTPYDTHMNSSTPTTPGKPVVVCPLRAKGC